VNAGRLGRLVRVLRVRQRLTQADLAARARVSRRAVSLLERGHASAVRLGDAQSVAVALDGRMDVRLLWHGPELDRLMDAGHAALAASVKRRLERWRWLVRVEVSYSRYGERGRIDLLAWHPVTRILLVLELKTELVDVQALLGSLDVKARLARFVAGSLGWEVTSVVPGIVFAENRTTRRHLDQLSTLFDAYAVRGREAISWLQRPHAPTSGMLWFVSTPDGAVVTPPRRVRPRRLGHLHPGRASAGPAHHRPPGASVEATPERHQESLLNAGGADVKTIAALPSSASPAPE
jgi:transcriptional regulator with XRE-family HTH domain